MTDTERAQPRRLEYMPLNELLTRLDPANVKAHDDEGIDASLDRFGYTEPVMLDERTGRLVAGHGRIQRLHAQFARRQATSGDQDPDTVAEPPPDGISEGVHGQFDELEWFVPVVRGWYSDNDDEARAYMVAANRLTEAGGWTDGLGPLLAELAQTNQGLPPGFDQGDVDALLAGLNPDFQPTDGTDQPRLDRKFHLVCNNCGGVVDPATAQQVEQ